MKKTIVVIAYRMNIEGLLELNAEAPIFEGTTLTPLGGFRRPSTTFSA